MNTSKLIALTALLGLTCSAANAGTRYVPIDKQPLVASHCDTGYIFGYGGITAGGTYNNQGRLDNGIAVTNPTLDYDMDYDWIFGGGIGMYSKALGGSRFEIEAFRSGQAVNNIYFDGLNLPSTGHIKTNAIMVNFLKEIPLGRCTGYIGGGIGTAEVRHDIDLFGVVFDDSDRALAYQFIAGIDVPLSDCVALFTQYKFLAVQDLRHIDSTAGGLQNFSDLYTHSVMAGLRLSF